MQPILNKLVTACFLIFATTSLSAQTVTSVVSGTVSEKVLAELWVNKRVDNKLQRVAAFKISPNDRNFIFAISPDSVASYTLQLNLLKPGGHHPTIDKIGLISFPLNPQRNYSLKIAPSQLDSTHKKGWQLTPDAAISQYALIKGKVDGAIFNVPLSLSCVVNGELSELCSVSSNRQGEFAIPVRLQQAGFYYLTSPRWRVRLYLHAREKLQLEIDNKTGLITSTDSHGSNQLLYQWQQLIAPITRYGYNLSTNNLDSFDLNSYIGEYKKLQPAMERFLTNFDITDQQEYRAVQNAMILDRDLAPINLLFKLSAKKIGPFMAAPKEFNEVPEFYHQFIQPKKFGNTSLLVLGEARQYLRLYALMNLALVPKEKRENLSKAERLQLMMGTISNDTLKSFFFKDQMDATVINNLSEFKETFEPFSKYAQLSPANETYKSIYGLFGSDTAYIGKPSYNFSLPDTSGRLVSMKNFKGKVVFIDVWATWCGPCRAQFPFLKEIEEEYANTKEMVFVGISLDKIEARSKWLEMIKKEKLGGVQLLDDFGKAFGRKYEIAAIPRFMLIDKQGRWIEIRCPLPEAKKDLKKYLDRALAE